MLALIGQGKTNTEIAAELFVSDGTVKTHISHLFTKLQLRDRAAGVVFAFDHDLVTPAQHGPGGRPAGDRVLATPHPAAGSPQAQPECGSQLKRRMA